MSIKSVLVLGCLCLINLGCSSAKYHREQVDAAQGGKLTAGVVQKEIRIGMSGGDVASVLGSPNIVSTLRPKFRKKRFS